MEKTQASPMPMLFFSDAPPPKNDVAAARQWLAVREYRETVRPAPCWSTTRTEATSTTSCSTPCRRTCTSSFRRRRHNRL